MTTGTIETTQPAPQPAAVVRAHVDVSGLPAFLGGAFGEVMQLLAGQQRAPAGPPFGRYRQRDGGFDVEAGFPVTGPIEPAGRVEAAELPGGTVVTALHRGGYGTVGETYQAILDWLPAQGYEPAGEPWESYLDGPEVAEPRTVVSIPCRRA